MQKPAVVSLRQVFNERRPVALTSINLGASVNGKPTVSKAVTAGSIPAAPAILLRRAEGKLWYGYAGISRMGFCEALP